MIDWWGVAYNLLWILGLTGGLAALSMASYRARTQEVPLRQEVSAPGFQLPFNAAMVLFCLGLLFSGRSWWEMAIWGLLAALFAGQLLWLWRRQWLEARVSRPEPPATTRQVAPQHSRWAGRLGWGLVLAGVVVLGAWAVATGIQVLGHARS